METTQILSLLGGIGLFLYGMTVMSSGLRAVAGDRMRDILERVAGNRVAATAIGVLVTLLIQSSSATDMMVIGFVSAGMMRLAQAVGVIMGASIGTTVTAQITAFNLTAYAPLLLFAGCIMALFFRGEKTRSAGSIIMGFGMLFVGVGMMKNAIRPLAATPGFAAFLHAMEHPLAALLFGLGFTALLQSSSSSVVIFQAFAMQGLLTLNQTMWLLIGAAMGSVTPIVLASLTADREGKRAALLNVLFNLFRMLTMSLLVLLLPQVPRAVAGLTPGDPGRQAANLHTFFAILSVLLALPLSEGFVRLTMRLLPPLPAEERMKQGKQLMYLNQTSNSRVVPAMIMKLAMLEAIRMGRMARDNLETALQYFFHPENTSLRERVLETEEVVDYLNHAVTDRLVELRGRGLSERDVFRLTKIAQVVSNFERISDHAENIVEFADRIKENQASISEVAMGELRTMGEAVMQTLDVSMRVFESERFSLLPEAEALEQRVDDMQEQYISNHIERLMQTQCNPLGGVIFTDMCTDLERCSDQAINIATALHRKATDPAAA